MIIRCNFFKEMLHYGKECQQGQSKNGDLARA